MCIIHRDLNSHNCLIKLVCPTTLGLPRAVLLASLSPGRLSPIALDQRYHLGLLSCPSCCLQCPPLSSRGFLTHADESHLLPVAALKSFG